MATVPLKNNKIVTIFRSRVDEANKAEYAALAPEIYALAEQIPGFLSAKTFSSKDGEKVTIVEFDSWESHNAWNDHPRHREVKVLGARKFYLEYDITVCGVYKEHKFKRGQTHGPK